MKKNNSYKIFNDCLERLKAEWTDSIKPFIEFDKNQGRKYDKFIQEGDVVMKREPEPKDHIQTFLKIPPEQLYDIYSRVYTDEDCDGSPYEVMGELTNATALTRDGKIIPIEMGKRVLMFNEEKAKYFEQRKIANLLKSLHFQFIQKLATEVMRAMLVVCSELGYKNKDFSLDKFFTFSDGIIKDKSQPKIETLPKYNAFNLLFKLNNFLKHNTVQAYLTLKKHYPDNIDKNNKTRYENGMYAGDFVYLQAGYFDKIFDKLLIFFAEYCKVILGETRD
ncbi:MAG: hypothetical protein FWD82_00300 [Defluviitaleaceae bacterium]|nr:hypothetical protein [Defluviitaleaceae bacterium]